MLSQPRRSGCSLLTSHGWKFLSFSLGLQALPLLQLVPPPACLALIHTRGNEALCLPRKTKTAWNSQQKMEERRKAEVLGSVRNTGKNSAETKLRLRAPRTLPCE